MADVDPTPAATTEASRLAANERAEQRQPAERPEQEDADRSNRLDPPDAAERRSEDMGPRADRLDVSAAEPMPATGREGPRDADEARSLAEETSERIRNDPERAADSVRDTGHEPATTRINRAVEAMT